jgi:hypothetical protein
MYSDIASSTKRKEGVIVESILNSTNNNQYVTTERLSSDYKYNEGSYKVPYQFFSGITKQILKKQEEYCRFVQINSLTTKRLSRAIDIIIEYDEEYYIARSLDLPLYACGNDSYEAIQNIKDEIESVYFELREDDNFSDEWINYKRFLNSIVQD